MRTLSIILLFISPLANKECSFKKEAYNYIINDNELASDFDIGNDFKLSVSKKSIVYDVRGVQEGVLRKNYIADYNLMGHYDSLELLTIKNVSDSLEKISNQAALVKSKTKYSNCKIKERKESDLTVFFSQVYENTIYAEVVETKGITASSGIYGKGRTYLFVFKNGKLEEVFNGTVHFN